ncbi:uncharacterized protein LOC122381883 [Amphibalanus amphitrite]|uniref:uncharacterized protein LOC122381883 n=1 Tax=Amphibalanus amphitrite TaxID=1232801 RepID=UPI001C8FB5A1|nr:uncharacterized protein LOC122381883 [Amphibalanus amphitrite]
MKYLREKQALELKEQELKMKKEELELQQALAESEAIETALTASSPNSAVSGGVDQHANDFGQNPVTVKQVSRPQVSAPEVGGVDGEDPHSALMRKLLTSSILPKPEIPVFSGDPTRFHQFLRAFDGRIDSVVTDEGDKLCYLEQFTSGVPRDIVRGCMFMSSGGYQEARRLLLKRYGNPQKMTESFIERLMAWPQVRNDDVTALDRLAVELRTCSNAVGSLGGADELNHPKTLRRLLEKLPFSIQEGWRREVDRIAERNERQASFTDLVNFVEVEARIASNSSFGRQLFSNFSKKTSDPRSSSPRGQVKKCNRIEADQQRACLFCGEEHHVEACKNLRMKCRTERETFVKNNGLCFGCLNKGHVSKFCNRRRTCAICKKRHPTSLHYEQQPQPPSEGERMQSPQEQTRVKSLGVDLLKTGDGLKSRTPAVMMSILPVRVWSSDGGKEVETYAFLDGGSSATFCSRSLLDELGVVGEDTKISMTTASVENQELDSRVVRGLKVASLDGDNMIPLPPTYTLSAIPVKHEDMASSEDVDQCAQLRGIELPRIDAEIGLLIGNDCPEALQPVEIRRSRNGGPYAIRTDLGWVVQGPRHNSLLDGRRVKVNRVQVDKMKLDEMLVNMYDKEFPEKISATEKGPSEEDRRWMEKVTRSCKRQANGHFQIGLPFRDTDPAMPNNKTCAQRRLVGLKKKLEKDVKFSQDYRKFMEDMFRKGHAEKVPTESLTRNDGKVWYIPHHGVYHPFKQEKIRVVFDCAARFRGVSLNSVLMQGPDLANSLTDVLVQFREGPCAFMADVEAMFYQVAVPEEDRDVMRFLWWPGGDFSRDPEEFRMTVHCFGASSSPSCANFALRKCADDKEDCDPEVSKAVKQKFYVDDCLVSVETPEDAVKMAKELKDVCDLGGFRLTKFVSNSRELLESVPKEERGRCVTELNLSIDALPVEKALGVCWTLEDDALSVRVTTRSSPATRRGVLSMIAAMYDPLGIVSPAVLRGRLIMQDLMRLQLDWDSSIPLQQKTQWEAWVANLPGLAKVTLPRCYRPVGFGDVVSAQLHNFSDASQQAYACVTYLRLTNSAGKVHCAFVFGKARVAPLKAMTIPRLELAAATMAVRISTMLEKALEMSIHGVYYWTDSTTVLRYIRNDRARYHTFVTNRLAVIRDGSATCQWRHVGSKQNPADDATRGVQTERWLRGPEFLCEEEARWPQMPAAMVTEEDDPEVRKEVKVATAVIEEETPTWRLIRHYSTWYRLKRAVVWIRRVAQILKARKSGKEGASFSGRITVEELDQAERAIVGVVQASAFQEELSSLKRGGLVKRSSPLFRLNPQIQDGIICVGGRLGAAPVHARARHPFLLPGKGHVTDLVIRAFHALAGHSGREHVLAALRSRYWIIKANSAVRAVLSRCTSCRRRQAPVVSQVMSDLPPERVTPDEPPFTKVGCDYFGPFFVKSGRRQSKRYGVLFTCLTTRGVHIEVANSLDTSSFINALRRFQARRGQVQYIRSDNGTNFVGAEHELREAVSNLNSEEVHNFLLQKGITWIFNAPGASSHGGVWERQVRTIRKVLEALLQEQTMDDEAVHTLMCEVENVINSRPLTPVSSDPADLEPITPNHLLLLRGGAVPPGIFVRSDSFCKRRWRQVQYLADIFWRRWVSEYLPLLQHRQKWMKTERNLSVGDLVLVVDLSLPRLQWPLGRVAEVFPDASGHVRTVIVKTARSVLKRPINKLVLVQEE